MSSFYLGIKVVHLVFVVGWFVGLLYVPRLFVNIATTGEAVVRTHLQLMARRLLRFSTILAGIALATGLALMAILTQGFEATPGWLWGKVLVVALLLGFHLFCALEDRKIANGYLRSPLLYRWVNELPLVFLALIAWLVVVRPF